MKIGKSYLPESAISSFVVLPWTSSCFFSSEMVKNPLDICWVMCWVSKLQINMRQLLPLCKKHSDIQLPMLVDWCGFVLKWVIDRRWKIGKQCSNPIWLLDWIMYGGTQVIIGQDQQNWTGWHPQSMNWWCAWCLDTGQNIAACHDALLEDSWKDPTIAHLSLVDDVWWGQFLAVDEWLVNFVAPMP